MSKTVLFDLDGTLTDSAEGIILSIQYALSQFGYEENDAEKLRSFLGPNLTDQMQLVYGFDEEQAAAVVEKYRERYTREGMLENKVYPGIVEVLSLLKRQGIRTGVASAKPEEYAKRIIQNFGLDSYFDVVVGSEMHGNRRTKAQVIEEALLRLHMSDKRESVLLIGDRKYDVEGAKACGIFCIGAGYGYGGRRELEDTGADIVVGSVSELYSFFKQYPEKEYKRELKRQSFFQQLWRCMYPILIHFGVLFLLSNLAYVALFFLYGVLIGNGTDYVQGIYMQLSVPITGVAEIITIPIMWWLYKMDRRRRTGFIQQHISPPLHRVTTVPLILAIVVFSAALGQSCGSLIDISQISRLFPHYYEMVEESFTGQPMIVMLIVTGILAPLAEELVFRGLVYRRIKDYTNRSVGMVISALAFGIYHGNMIQFLFATMLGLGFVWLYERFGTLWAPILAHAVVNCISTLLSGLLDDSAIMQNALVYYGAFAVECVLLVISAVYISHRTEKERL